MKKLKNNLKKGFTLVELLVLLAFGGGMLTIIGVLGFVAFKIL